MIFAKIISDFFKFTNRFEAAHGLVRFILKVKYELIWFKKISYSN